MTELEIETEAAKIEVMQVGHRFVAMLRVAAGADWTVRVDGRTALLAIADMLEQTTEEVTQ